jgi:hypothetical protein
MQAQLRRWVTSTRGVRGVPLEGDKFLCALCRGKGELPSAKGRCPACRGHGYIKLAPPVMVCAYCSGRGEVPARSRITCPVCGGKGVISVQPPIEVCPQCGGTGAAANSKLPCLICQGKGVVTTREYVEGITGIKASHAEKRRVKREAEPSPISLYEVPLPGYGPEVDERQEADYLWQSQRSRATRMVSPGAVGSLVRRLMATERARILGRGAIDIGRYALEKRSQRWKESRTPFR